MNKADIKKILGLEKEAWDWLTRMEETYGDEHVFTKDQLIRWGAIDDCLQSLGILNPHNR